ncbi:phage head-tail joining protein [Mycoplana ramosa]|uniref:Phage head-tail joining protein n=1 Tax=Mycoplana ramosa TaxID=40837 RepID=A0ABW3YWN4_MYCRA
MAWTQADLDAINTAIATGAKRVRFQTHEVEYQSVTDLLRARDIIKGELEGGANGGGAIFSEYHGGY